MCYATSSARVGVFISVEVPSSLGANKYTVFGARVQPTRGFPSISHLCVHYTSVFEELTSTDVDKVVVHERYGRTETGEMTTRRESSRTANSVSPCLTYSALGGGGARKGPNEPHSIHRTTQALSPELKECATQCPQSAGPAEAEQTGNSILEFHCF